MSKTAIGKRKILIDANTVQVLRQYQKRQHEVFLKKGKSHPSHNLVFTTRNGDAVKQYTVRVMFQMLAQKAGLPQMRFRDIRYTHAVLLLQTGLSPKVVAERLGYSNSWAFLDTYSHVLPDQQQKAAVIIEEMIWPSEKNNLQGDEIMLTLPARSHFPVTEITFVIPEQLASNPYEFKTLLRNQAKKEKEYFAPIKTEPLVHGMTDEGESIPIDTLGKWLFGTPGYKGHIATIPFANNKMIIRIHTDQEKAVSLIEKAAEKLGASLVSKETKTIHNIMRL